jgi:hypothetical protein
VVVLSTLGFDEIDDLFLVVHGDETPFEQDWQRLVAATRDSRPRITRGLIIAGRSKLDAGQRRSLAEALKTTKLNVAVLVASPLARGTVTALGWVLGGYRAFDMHELDKAFAYLQVSQAHQARTRRSIEEIRGRLSSANEQSGAPSNR